MRRRCEADDDATVSYVVVDVDGPREPYVLLYEADGSPLYALPNPIGFGRIDKGESK